jgi:hypothetical protein
VTAAGVAVEDPQDLGRSAGGGGLLGMYLSAILVDLASWRWLFVLSVALVVVEAESRTWGCGDHLEEAEWPLEACPDVLGQERVDAACSAEEAGGDGELVEEVGRDRRGRWVGKALVEEPGDEDGHVHRVGRERRRILPEAELVPRLLDQRLTELAAREREQVGDERR